MTNYIAHQGLHKLSAAAVRTLTRRGWHNDSGGLHLEIDDNGRKRWALRLTMNGRRRDFGLGSVTKVSLDDAREAAADYRRIGVPGRRSGCAAPVAADGGGQHHL